MSKATIITRAALVLGVLTAAVGGVTYALFQSTATLTNNTFSSATAELLVDGSDVDTDATASEAGFSFPNLFPGAADFTAPQTFSLKNNGTAAMTVSVYAVGGTQTGTIDKSKVHVKLVKTSGSSANATYNLQQLVDLFNPVPGVEGPTQVLAAGATETFTMQVKLDADAVSNGAALSGFNFVFTGTGVEVTP